MKNNRALLFALLLSPALSFAQVWSLGIRHIPEMDFKLGKSSPSSDLKLKSSISHGYGGNYRFCYNHKSYYSHGINSISVEAVYINRHQTYEGQTVSAEESAAPIKRIYDFSFQSIEIPIMVHSKNDDYGVNGELGLSYSLIFNKSGGQFDDGAVPVKFRNSNIYAIVGTGWDFKLSRNFFLTTGARAYYPMLDMTKKTAGVEGYHSTRILRASLILGVSYYVDYHGYNRH